MGNLIVLFLFSLNPYCLYMNINSKSAHHTLILEKNKSELQHLTLLSGKVKLMIPDNLFRVNDVELLKEYPIKSQRPTYIFDNKPLGIKLSINYGSTNAYDKDLPQIKAYLEKLYKNSLNNFISSDIEVVNNKRYIIMKFQIRDQKNTELYNYMFITTVSGKLFMADYSFPTDELKEHEKEAKSILNSTQITD